MDKNKLKAFFKNTFNSVAGGYDHPSMRFFQDSAQRFVSYLNLRGDENILDVATGTGWVSIAIAREVTSGQVTGIDLSDEMLAQAMKKSKAQEISNICFKEMDMEEMTFPKNYFDAAVSAFGIFFVQDISGLISHISTKIKPGGSIITSTFYKNLFSPLADKLLSRLEKYDIEIPPMAWKGVSTKDQCNTLFKEAGLKNVCCDMVDAGYFLQTPQDWWHIVWNGGYRGLVSQLSAHDMEKFKVEHLKEVKAISTSDGIRLELSVLYTKGTKP